MSKWYNSQIQVWDSNVLTWFRPISLSPSLPAESCGGVVQGLNGTIESPGFPHGYPNYANCTWLIITGERNRIQLTFVTLALEEDFDIVSVYDGQPSPGNLKMRLEMILSFSQIFCSAPLLLSSLFLSLFEPLWLPVWVEPALFYSSSTSSEQKVDIWTAAYSFEYLFLTNGKWHSVKEQWVSALIWVDFLSYWINSSKKDTHFGEWSTLFHGDKSSWTK